MENTRRSSLGEIARVALESDLERQPSGTISDTSSDEGKRAESSAQPQTSYLADPDSPYQEFLRLQKLKPLDRSEGFPSYEELFDLQNRLTEKAPMMQDRDGVLTVHTGDEELIVKAFLEVSTWMYTYVPSNAVSLSEKVSASGLLTGVTKDGPSPGGR